MTEGQHHISRWTNQPQCKGSWFREHLPSRVCSM